MVIVIVLVICAIGFISQIWLGVMANRALHAWRPGTAPHLVAQEHLLEAAVRVIGFGLTTALMAIIVRDQIEFVPSPLGYFFLVVLVAFPFGFMLNGLLELRLRYRLRDAPTNGGKES